MPLGDTISAYSSFLLTQISFTPFIAPVPNILSRIHKLREFCAYSQAAVAWHPGITRTAYSCLENRQTRLRIEHTKQITAFYGLTAAHLMTKDYSPIIPITNTKEGGTISDVFVNNF